MHPRSVIACPFLALCRVTFRDPVNQSVSCRLVKEVHGLNPNFDAADIRSKSHVYCIALNTYNTKPLCKFLCVWLRFGEQVPWKALEKAWL